MKVSIMEGRLLVAYNDDKLTLRFRSRAYRPNQSLPPIGARSNDLNLRPLTLGRELSLVIGDLTAATLRTVPLVDGNGIDVPILGIQTTIPEHLVRIIQNRRSLLDRSLSFGLVTINMRIGPLHARYLKAVSLTKAT